MEYYNNHNTNNNTTTENGSITATIEIALTRLVP
jgi:hypothetical protein